MKLLWEKRDRKYLCIKIIALYRSTHINAVNLEYKLSLTYADLSERPEI